MTNMKTGPTRPTPLPIALSTEQAAIHLGITTSALAQLRQRGQGPEYIKVGRQVRYLPDDIRAWWDEHRVRGHSSVSKTEHGAASRFARLPMPGRRS